MLLLGIAMIAWGFLSGLPPRSGDSAQLRAEIALAEARIGLRIGTGDIESFQNDIQQPLQPRLAIKPTSPERAAIALPALEEALSRYPKSLVQFYIDGVFLADSVAVEGVHGAGTYANRAIYISTETATNPERAHEVALTFHHEFSSFLYFGVVNKWSPGDQWDKQNPTGFQYPTSRAEILGAAEVYPSGKQAPGWYEEGFVSLYGKSSKENDINAYAELLMGDPGQLLELAARWPRIDAKARILARFYASIDPGLETSLRNTTVSSLLPAPPPDDKQLLSDGSE